MEPPLQNVERRLQEALLQLKNETTIFERLMYKNVNQHRRALYFRRLCQVRRDLRLLQSANLSELIQSVLQCLENNATKLTLREGEKQSTGGKPEVLALRRRLYGVSRLLEQIYDPILNASLQVAGLLGQTFFMPFSLTMLSMLARIRVLVVQCLHDLVTIFNVFSEWASNKELIDHNFHALPISVSCKWDDRKLSLAGTTAQHWHESHTKTQLGFVEDPNGRKYMVLESVVLGDTATEPTETSNGGVEGVVQSKGPKLTMSDEASKWLNSVVFSVEKANVHDSAHGLDSSAQVTDRENETSDSIVPMLQDHVPPKEASQCVSSRLLSENNPKAGNDFVPAPKKVAYVSLLSASESKAEKTEDETPPLKKQRTDSLFDMLLGLGGDIHKTLF